MGVTAADGLAREVDRQTRALASERWDCTDGAPPAHGQGFGRGDYKNLLFSQSCNQSAPCHGHERRSSQGVPPGVNPAAEA